MALEEAQRFLRTIPLFDQFEEVMNDGNYRSLPNGWALAVADIVDSTGAIARGKYKAVNMAGVSVISAILNAAGDHDLPFVFGGDGALVAVPPSAIGTARTALAAVMRWVDEEHGMKMRAALVPIEDIRAQGLDARLARFQASSEIVYAMFTGGGSHWAESEMKAGRYKIEPAPPGTMPDLAGLSCRWQPIAAGYGAIASVIAVPASPEMERAFRRLVADIVLIASSDERNGHPIVEEGPRFGLTLAGLDMEARARARPGKRWWSKLAIVGQYFLAVFLYRTHIKLGRFDAHVYTHDVRMNTDFRKFDDGLKMTIDVDPERLAALKNRLEEAEQAGVCHYGLHLQDAALMTCFVPTPLARGHMHFIDGAQGGYAVAASQIKERMRAEPQIAPG